MKTRFELGEKVVWSVDDHTFRLIYSSQPMEVVDMHYQHAILEPQNPTQKKFFDAGFWPYLTDQGLIYTVRYWPDNKYDEDGRRLLPGKNYGEAMIHEKWLRSYAEERFIIAHGLLKKSGVDHAEFPKPEHWAAADKEMHRLHSPHHSFDENQKHQIVQKPSFELPVIKD